MTCSAEKTMLVLASSSVSMRPPPTPLSLVDNPPRPSSADLQTNCQYKTGCEPWLHTMQLPMTVYVLD